MTMQAPATERLREWFEERGSILRHPPGDDDLREIVAVVLNLFPEDEADADDILVGRFWRAIQAEFGSFMGLDTKPSTWRRVARGILSRAGLISEKLPDGRTVFVLEER